MVLAACATIISEDLGPMHFKQLQVLPMSVVTVFLLSHAAIQSCITTVDRDRYCLSLWPEQRYAYTMWYFNCLILTGLSRTNSSYFIDFESISVMGLMHP